MSSAVDGMPAPARAVGGARAAAAAPSEEPASLPNEAASNSDATELSNITKDTAFVEVEDEEPNPAPPAQVDLSPEERFEEYPFLNNPLFAKSGPLGAVLKYLVLGPDVTTPRRGVLPDFYADGRVIKEGRKSAPTNDGPAVNAKRRNSVLSIGSTASADRPWTRYDMYPAFWKTMITAVCGITGVLGALTGSVFSPALPYMQAEFGVTTMVANLSLTVGILALGLMPIFWAPLADLYGRRWVLLVSQIVNIIGNIGCYLSPNIGVFLAMRVVSTGGAGAGLAVCPGVIVDIFRKEERGRAMGMYSLGSLIGPVIAPLIGGSVTQSLGWRYIFVVGCALAAFVFILTFIFVPETLRGDPKLKKRPNPLRAFYYISYPFVLCVVLYSSTSFMAFYLYPSVVPRDFLRLYGFNAASVGYVQAALGVGMMIGSVVGGWATDRSVNGWKQRRGVYVQEDRLRSTTLGIVFNLAGLLLYGWSINSHWPWPVPAVAMVLTGYGQMIIGASTGTYFVDTFSTEASSITAMSNCTRFVMGAIAPLIAAPGYSSMGPGGFFTLVSGLILLTSLGLAYVVVFGTQDRVKRKPWSENVEMAAKQLAAVKASRGTGWFSQKMKRTKRADEPPEMAEKVDPANRILKDEAALA